MPFGPHPCDDPSHSKTVGPVDMVVLKHLYRYMSILRYVAHGDNGFGKP
jgi:hypothetical protein